MPQSINRTWPPAAMLDTAIDVLGRIDPLELQSEEAMIAWAQAVADVAHAAMIGRQRL